MESSKNIFLDLLILFLTISLTGLGVLFGYAQFVTYALIPLMLIYCIQLNSFKFFSFNNTYIKLFFSIILWSILLIFISIDQNVALNEITKSIGVFLVMLIVLEAIAYFPDKYIKWFLFSYVIAFYIISTHLLLRVGTTTHVSDAWIDRSNDTLGLNANTYSYFSFFANIALFYLIELTRKKVYIIISIFSVILAFYLSFITASRSGMLFLILIVTTYWLLIFSTKGKYKALRFILTIIILIYSSTILNQYYENSFLKKRVDISIQSDDARERLINEAVNVFIDNPFLGVGPGQFFLYESTKQSFSHNSYTEIAANLGIIGLILLLIIFVRPLIKAIKTFFIDKNPSHSSLNKLNILFFATFILYNNFYVFYLTTYGMMFFIVIISVQEKYIKNGKK